MGTPFSFLCLVFEPQHFVEILGQLLLSLSLSSFRFRVPRSSEGRFGRFSAFCRHVNWTLVETTAC